jgi:hypothetical protein
MNSIITNAKDRLIGQQSGSLPNMMGTLGDWSRPIAMSIITKLTSNFQTVEEKRTIEFNGNILPMPAEQLRMKPEGERSWSWALLFAPSGVVLNTDDIVSIDGIPYRVMKRKNWSYYGFLCYEMIEDYTMTEVNNGE